MYSGRLFWKYLTAVFVLTIVAVLVHIAMTPVIYDDRLPRDWSNLRQLAMGLSLYISDNAGLLPSSAVINGSSTWNPADCRRFVMGGGGFRRQGAGKVTSWARLLGSDYLKGGPSVCFCPEDPVDRKNANSPASYWWKTAIDKAWYGVGCARPCRKLADYKWQADQILFYEHNTWHFGQGAKGLTNGATICAGFMDGHAKIIKISNATSGNVVDCSVNSDGEPMYYNCNMRRKVTANGPARYADPRRYGDKF